MSYEAGKLRHRVRIQKLDYVRDSNGEVIQDPYTGETEGEWVTIATVWAAIEPVSAREFMAAQAIQSAISARIVIRYRDGLNASMRFVHVRTGRPDVVYDPHGFLADKDSGLEYLTIPVSTGVSTSGQ
jgi:SPP1 family predicted phage head-tail adaptor